MAPPRLRGHRRSICRSISLACFRCLRYRFSLTAQGAAADPLAVVSPVGSGPYPVACSDVDAGFHARCQKGEMAEHYWEGTPDGSACALCDDAVDGREQRISANRADSRGQRALTGSLRATSIAVVSSSAIRPRRTIRGRPTRFPTASAVPHMHRLGNRRYGPTRGRRFPVLAVLAWSGRESAFGGLPRRDQRIREPRVRGRRAVPRRLARRRHRARQLFGSRLRACPLQGFHRAAGTATARVARGARRVSR